MANQAQLGVMPDPSDYTGDQTGYCEALRPEMDHLLVAAEALDGAREAHYEEMADPKDPKLKWIHQMTLVPGNDPRLDERSERALKVVMDYFVWQYGKMIGLDREDRQYLTFEDIDKASMGVILSSRLPEKYREQGFEIFQRLQRNELRRALFVPHINPDAPQNTLARVNGMARNRIQTDKSAHTAHIRHAEYGIPYHLADLDEYAGKLHYNSEFSAEKLRTNEKRGRDKYIACKIKTQRKGRENRDDDDSTYVVSTNFAVAAFWEDVLMYKCNLDLEDEYIDKARLVKCNGKILRTVLTDTKLVAANDNIEVENCNFTHGELKVGSGLKVKSGFFHGTKMHFEDGSSAGASFEACDFSHAQIDDASLQNIAKASTKCRFSKAQLSIIQAEEFFDQNDHQDAEQISAALGQMFVVDERNFAGPEAPQLLVSRNIPVGIDFHDPKRNEALTNGAGDLADVPILRNTLLNQRYIDEKYYQDLRVLFPPLGPKEADKLAARLRFLPKLIEFLDTHHFGYEGKFTSGKFLAFIQEQGTDACLALGLNEVVLNLNVDLDNLPHHGLKHEDHRRGSTIRIPVTMQGKNGKYHNDFITFEDEEIPKIIKAKVEKEPAHPFADAFEEVQRYATLSDDDYIDDDEPGRERPYDAVVSTHTGYSQLQILAKQLEALARRLLNYKAYLGKLLKTHKYSYPTVNPDSDKIILEGISHPNLPTIIEKKADKAKAAGKQVSEVTEPVPFTVELEPGKNKIIAITAPNAEGKTLTLTTILEMVAQAQAGAPCKGQVEVGLKGMYDRMFLLSNKKAKAGGSESGLEGRAAVIKEFLDNLEKDPDGEPVNVLIGLDEIIMDATNHTDASTVEYNLIKRIMENPRIKATVLMVSHNKEVINWLRIKFPEDVKILVPNPEQRHGFIEGDEPAKSDPTSVFERFGLADLLEKPDVAGETSALVEALMLELGDDVGPEKAEEIAVAVLKRVKAKLRKVEFQAAMKAEGLEDLLEPVDVAA